VRFTLLLFSLLLFACASANSGPTVVVVPYESDSRVEPWSKKDISYIEAGAEAWTKLGFLYKTVGPSDIPYEGSMQRCPRDWAEQDMTECTIPVGVTHEAFLIEDDSIVGYTDRANYIISIDSRFHEYDLQSIAAHEFGHMLLNTGRHLDVDQYGIMLPSMNQYTYPTHFDYKLACEETSICIE
jgi:hypothetical protein